MRPDVVTEVEGALAAIRRRLAARQALHALTGAAAAAGALAMVMRWTDAPAGAIAAAMVATAAVTGGWWLASGRRGRTSAAAAHTIERARPECRNVVVTAEELLRHPGRARPWIASRVLADALSHLSEVAPASIVRLRRSGLFAVVAVALALTAAATGPQHIARRTDDPAMDRGAQPPVREGELRITLTLRPPDYVGGAPRTLTNPLRVEALQGTRVHLAIAGRGSWRVRFGDRRLSLRAEPEVVVADIVLEDSGYFAIEPLDARATSKMLLPVLVTPDRAPVIRVEEPGRDLLLPAARAVPVRASVTDDLGLRAMSLRYTRVSGSGERFEFVEGELPIAIAREGARAWRARGDLPLASLGLEPGDSLVYRVIARDGRDGTSGLGSSDTFFIEIAGPGQATLEGFEMPPDRERHALSQQMIVLKIDRLRAQQRGLARAAVQERTTAIAAEQRTVRANFTFLMGGHVEDEFEEAEHSHEIQEGRLENAARREVSSAVRHMTYVEQSLAANDTATALREARLAVEALQRAFGRNRYLLRALPVRSRIDPSRRLSGDLAGAAGWRRNARERVDEPTAAAREIMGRLIALSSQIAKGQAPPDAAAELTVAAERALQVDPDDATWQMMAERLLTVREAIATRQSGDKVERALREALSPVVSVLREHATPQTDLPDAGALRRAWVEEARR